MSKREEVIDECIEAIKLGMARDGHGTSHYKQSMKHIDDLRKLKSHSGIVFIFSVVDNFGLTMQDKCRGDK